MGRSQTRSLRKSQTVSCSSQQLQYRHRPDHRPPTDANGLEAANGYPEKSGAHRHLCAWFRVRVPVHASACSGADIQVHSVCIITIIRLILSTQLQLDDYTYDISAISVVTIMEPLLGIIIACLPFFPPAIKKLAGQMKRTDSEKRNVLSSSMARLRLKRSKSSASPGFDDTFPLTNLEDKGIQNRITGPSRRLDYMSEGYGQFAEVRIPPLSSIMVEQEWEVRSDKARNAEGKL